MGDAVGDDLSPGLGHVVLPPRRRLLREQERPGRPRLHLALLREEEEGAGTRTVSLHNLKYFIYYTIVAYNARTKFK